MSKSAPVQASAASSAGLWLLIVIYAASRFLPLIADKIPIPAIAALHILPPLLFALIHGAQLLGRRTILTFFALFLLVGNVMENLSVTTGFPFGHYYFTDCLGPKVFHVPMMLGLAYVGIGYLSWTLALLILRTGHTEDSLAGFRIVALPLLASFPMTAWDLSMDPVWSTIQHCWIWQHGGAYFGVPVSNFIGWYFTVYIFYQLFALYSRHRPVALTPLPAAFWQLAVLFYALCAAGNLILLLGAPPGDISMVSDPSGVTWKVRDILGVSALVSIFVMGGFVLLAWIRLRLSHRHSEAPVL